MKKKEKGSQEVIFFLVMSLISTVAPETWALCSRSSPIARLLFSCFVAHGETWSPPLQKLCLFSRQKGRARVKATIAMSIIRKRFVRQGASDICHKYQSMIT